MTDNARPDNGAAKTLLGALSLSAIGVPLGALDAKIGADLYRWFVHPITGFDLPFLHVWGLLIAFGFVRTLGFKPMRDDQRAGVGDCWAARFAMVVMALGLWGIGAVIAGQMS